LARAWGVGSSLSPARVLARQRLCTTAHLPLRRPEMQASQEVSLFRCAGCGARSREPRISKGKLRCPNCSKPVFEDFATTAAFTPEGTQGGEVCAICQDAFKAGEPVSRLRSCSHAFHDGCVKPWLAEKETCPMCRVEVTQLVEQRRKKELQEEHRRLAMERELLQRLQQEERALEEQSERQQRGMERRHRGRDRRAQDVRWQREQEEQRQREQREREQHEEEQRRQLLSTESFPGLLGGPPAGHPPGGSRAARWSAPRGHAVSFEERDFPCLSAAARPKA